ncbi:hypothetical protein [Polaromonas sp.]|uniref:hypothetical protein n=1 Tax=Polaromonas sp. TaxID=1869339 RepID=UPI0025FDF4E5|nr:hypothetical protein [Polaromonas sp.]
MPAQLLREQVAHSTEDALHNMPGVAASYGDGQRGLAAGTAQQRLRKAANHFSHPTLLEQLRQRQSQPAVPR